VNVVLFRQLPLAVHLLAMAAPVFDESGRIVLCLTAIGPSSIFDERLDGVVARTLKASADDLSRQLGAESKAA